MNDRRPHLRRTVPVMAVAAFVAPYTALALQAAADQWHAPAALPQAYGTRGLRAVLDDPNLAAGARNSLAVALAATTVALVLGWPLARLIGRARHRGLAVGLVALPLLVPQAALGTGLSAWLLRLGLSGTIGGLVAAHLLQVFPYVTVTLTTGFTTRLGDLEDAADTLGATPARRFAHVTFPAMAPPATLAAALGFTVSWSQYGTSLVVAAGTPMLPLTMVPFLRADPQIGAVLTLLFLVPPVATAVAAIHAAPTTTATTARPGTGSDPQAQPTARRAVVDGWPRPGYRKRGRDDR